jgi:hypothetical protein
MRKLTIAAVTSVAMVLGALGVAASPADASTTPLLLPQSNAFAILGYWCGGIQEHSFATGFDAVTGFPTGDVFLSTTCSAGGKGGHSFTVTAWAAVTWDYTGVVVSSIGVSPAPTVDPTFSAFDGYGNEVYNSSNNAYLVLAPTFVPAPRLIGISVAEAPATGGTTVTLTGTGFTGATAVSFGASAAASYTVTNDNSITAVSPAGSPGTVYITVTSAGGTSATLPAVQFTLVGTPSVTALTPNNGQVTGGSEVTITGSNLAAVTSVTFGDTPAAFFVIDDSTINAIAPPAEAVDTESVVVSSIGGSSAGIQFSYLSGGLPAPPTVRKLTPAFGRASGGSPVTITGTNFVGATAVDFGSTPVGSFTVVSATSITTTAPAGAGIVYVTVTTGYGTSSISLANRFNYGPTITKLSPVQGPSGGNTRVVISGHNFIGATAVTFGGEPATAFTVSSAGTYIIATTPPQAGLGPESVDVVVTTPGGTTTLAAAFSYVAPSVTSISPTSGPVGGGTRVVIYGLNLYGATAVDFGSTAATITTVTNRWIIVVSPPGSGTVAVTVTDAAGTSPVTATGDQFTY